MYWTALIIETGAAHTEALSNLLIELGALSVDIHDAATGTEQEQSLFEQSNNLPKTIWSNVEITALFEEAVDVTEIMQMAAQSAQLPGLPVYRIKKVEDQDWVRLTQSQFGPIEISSRLWIVPSWHQVPDPAATNLMLDPGLAFGTGSHPTTKLCLAWLDENLQGGEQVLDYGCGSGILAIAALKLGAGRVVGVDIDHHAVESSIENVAQNQCDQNKAEFYLADYMFKVGQTMDGWADVVVANILANPLIMLAPLLMRASRNNGRIVLSGILTEQVKEVEHAYQQWFKMHLAREQGGWALLIGIRK
jgi:ribosomal protein L11 methyltransferase